MTTVKEAKEKLCANIGIKLPFICFCGENGVVKDDRKLSPEQEENLNIIIFAIQQMKIKKITKKYMEVNDD